MTAAVETEIKFRISDAAALATKLSQAGLRLVTPRTHEVNTLYDLPGRPLRQKGTLLRVRRYGNLWTVTFKGRASTGRYKSRPEIETVVQDGQSFMDILESSGFSAAFRYEKFRSEWTDGRVHVLIDETPIGNFGEIEGPGEGIDALANRLEISPAQYITDSYAVLFGKWKRQTRSKARHMCFAEIQ